MRMGSKKATEVNPEPETAIEGYKPHKIGVKEEKFCLQFVITDDRHLSYERAGYLATSPTVQSAAISRLLKQPKIKQRIEELKTEMLLAQGVTIDRITANLAEIAFNKVYAKVDRIKCLELLGKDRKMFSDNVNVTDTVKRAELDERERAEILALAAIRLGCSVMGAEGPERALEGLAEPLEAVLVPDGSVYDLEGTEAATDTVIHNKPYRTIEGKSGDIEVETPLLTGTSETVGADEGPNISSGNSEPHLDAENDVQGQGQAETGETGISPAPQG